MDNKIYLYVEDPDMVFERDLTTDKRYRLMIVDGKRVRKEVDHIHSFAANHLDTEDQAWEFAERAARYDEAMKNSLAQ